MSGTSEPRRLADALSAYRSEAAPLTLLAAVQQAWPQAAGAGIAAQAEPVAERDGVVTVACHSATWAQELDLMQDRLLGVLREALEAIGTGTELRGLRFSADAARHDLP